MTEKDFKVVKTLLENGLSNKQVEEVTGRASGTIWNIKKSKSYREYKETVRSWNKKKKSRELNVDIPVDLENIQNNPMILRDISDNILRLAVAVEGIANAVTPRKGAINTGQLEVGKSNWLSKFSK